MDVINALIRHYRSIGWWAARFNAYHFPDMIAAKGTQCVFISAVSSDREKPLIETLGKEQAEYLAGEKALCVVLACQDGDKIRAVTISWDEQQRLADGLRLRDLAYVGIVVDAGS